MMSRLAIAWNTSRPTPGRLNTFSTTTVPVSRLANCSPMIVSTGTKALRSTWRHSTSRSLRPLARAVRTKSSRSTSSTAERVMRARIAACTAASATAGSSNALNASHALSSQPGKPPAENHCSLTENTRINRIANQKFGSAMPSWLSVITPMSPTWLWRDAA